LNINDLKVYYYLAEGIVKAVDRVHLNIGKENPEFIEVKKGHFVACHLRK